MPPEDMECYSKRKQHNISVVTTLLEGDEDFYKAVVNYSKSARRGAPWQ